MESGAPGAIRTHDRLLRRQMLYPTELRAQPENTGPSPVKINKKYFARSNPRFTSPQNQRYAGNGKINMAN